MENPDSQQKILIRVDAGQVVVGDRLGEGRHQGVQVTQVEKYPRLADATTYHFELGSHGWVDYHYGARVLVERVS